MPLNLLVIAQVKFWLMRIFFVSD